MWSAAKNEVPRHRELVRNGALLLDVRTPDEYGGGHVNGAKNIPVDQLPVRLGEVGPTTRPVVVYCRSGARSARAAGVLRAAGYEVVDIGGMHGW